MTGEHQSVAGTCRLRAGVNSILFTDRKNESYVLVKWDNFLCASLKITLP